MIASLATKTSMSHNETRYTQTKSSEHLIFISLRRMIQQTKRRNNFTDDVISDVEMAANAILLPTDEFGRVKLAIKNAVTYFRQEERGAARFELTQILKRLCKMYPDGQAV